MNRYHLRASVAIGCTPRRQVLVALAWMALLLVPAVRQWLTASMWRHMVLQFPLWMLAGVSAPIEAAKCVALVVAGTALRLSWRAAGLVVQGFFLGNMLPMTAVVGQLYIDSPLRLCNAYLLDDQARLGQWLVGAAALVAVGWLAQVAWWVARREGASAVWVSDKG